MHCIASSLTVRLTVLCCRWCHCHYCSRDVTAEQLKETFSAFGAVGEARVVPTGRIRPFAFISYDNEADAAKAMAAMQVGAQDLQEHGDGGTRLWRLG